MNERTDRINFDPHALTERQLDGLACVACGATFGAGVPSVPVGEALGAQVFACTSHVPAEPMPLDAVERDLQRTIDRLRDAIDAHDPRALDYAVRTAELCFKRVRAWLDEQRR